MTRHCRFAPIAAAGLLVLSAASLDATPMRPLPPCPDTPNCVSSLAAEAAHRIAPLRCEGPPELAQSRLVAAIEALPRSRIVEQSPGWVRAEFRSRLLGFVDEALFTLDAQAGIIHVRSAARTGYWDLGANRRRVEALREALLQAASASGERPAR